MDFPILTPTAEIAFLCPGEAHPISRAVHAARLLSGWSRCESCPSRNDPAVDRSESQLATSPASFSAVIRRTRWGVRGPWQNAISRLQAGHLTAIVTSHLAQVMEQQQAAREPNDSERSTIASLDRRRLTLVAGYDGRRSSPDIFAGVVTAALHNGWNVLDAGHSTAASIQEALRFHSDATAAILVTGSGESSAQTGLDVFDVHGDAVSIPWQTFGIRVRQFAPEYVNQESSGPVLSPAAAHLRALKASVSETDARVHHGVSSSVILDLPATFPASASQFRTSRTSGELETGYNENPYRNWLSHWFPPSSSDRITCICFDELVAERLRWLSENRGIRLDVTFGTETRSPTEQLSQRIRETHSDWGIAINADDRYFNVANRKGIAISSDQLSHWINSTTRTTQSHLTTHVPDDDDRIVMLDMGRTAGHEVISDGLATFGLIGRITASGTPLP